MSMYDYKTPDPAPSATDSATETPPPPSNGKANGPRESSGAPLTTDEKKTLFLNVVVGIVLLEFAATVGAVVYSIANADKSAAGLVRFTFPWVGYLVTVALIPVLVMLILHLVSLGFSRTLGGEGSADGTMSEAAEKAFGGRAATFFALVRGAPTVILFAGFVLMGAAIYYLDGVMALLLKLGDSFQTVAVWLVGALGVAFCVNAVARAVLAYKTRQLEAEYAFRREIFERTGTILMSASQVALPPSEISAPRTAQAMLVDLSTESPADTPSADNTRNAADIPTVTAEIVDEHEPVPPSPVRKKRKKSGDG